MWALALIACLAAAPAAVERLQPRPPEVEPGCKPILRAAGARFVDWPVAPVPLEDRILCQVPQGLIQRRGGSGVQYQPPARINCAFALRLTRFEKVLQEEALQAFGKRAARIEQLGTYNCRRMAAYPDMVSEHSFANAIDIARIVMTGGRTVVVERDWVARAAAADSQLKPAALFLRRLTRRLFDEQIFSVVLTPSYDRHHRNHLHLDGAPYLVDGT
jgi:hypothetical protein